MKYGIMGAAVPLLMEKPTFEYLCKATPSIDSKTAKTYFKAIIARQPEIGGMKNNLIMGLYLAAYLMAVYQAAPEQMTDDVFAGLVEHITKSKRFASVTVKSYMRGYRDIYKSVGLLHKRMIRFCDSLVNMKIVKIDFAG